MIFTNKHNLPDYVVQWLTADNYDHEIDTVSATALQKPAKAAYLSRLHKDELSMDCSDLVAPRYGTALHDSFEKMGLGDRREERFYADFNGFKISGKLDMLIGDKLHDFKSTSVWKYIHADFEDYIIQLSIYRWLMHQNGQEVVPVGQICFLFTDWAGSKAKYDPTYPKSRVAVVDITLWDYPVIEEWIGERLVAMHDIGLDRLPDCTDKELWKDPDKWAVKKIGAKKAIKLYNSEKEAEGALKEGQEIEHRPSKAKRCGYCSALHWCAQAKEMQNNGQLDL